MGGSPCARVAAERTLRLRFLGSLGRVEETIAQLTVAPSADAAEAAEAARRETEDFAVDESTLATTSDADLQVWVAMGGGVQHFMRCAVQRHTDALLERVASQFARAVADDTELGRQVCAAAVRVCVCVWMVTSSPRYPVLGAGR